MTLEQLDQLDNELAALHTQIAVLDRELARRQALDGLLDQVRAIVERMQADDLRVAITGWLLGGADALEIEWAEEALRREHHEQLALALREAAAILDRV
jgi:hypothetical protein